jgi:hypothetical protein
VALSAAIESPPVTLPGSARIAALHVSVHAKSRRRLGDG